MRKIVLFLSILILASCTNSGRGSQASFKDIIDNNPITAERQALLTPGEILEMLKKGNQEFVENRLTVRNTPERIREAVSGQYPEAVILSCMDSRVPVEDIFHRGLGDLFVVRIAGNIVDEDILGSLEYACKASGSKVVVVLGHEYCGAIKSAINDVEFGNITALLSKIKPVVNDAKSEFDGETSSKNPQFVDHVSHKNVHHSLREIREKSSVLKEMEDKGEIIIVGAMYDMESGRVDFFEK